MCPCSSYFPVSKLLSSFELRLSYLPKLDFKINYRGLNIRVTNCFGKIYLFLEGGGGIFVLLGIRNGCLKLPFWHFCSGRLWAQGPLAFGFENKMKTNFLNFLFFPLKRQFNNFSFYMRCHGIFRGPQQMVLIKIIENPNTQTDGDLKLGSVRKVFF